jgi:hypothetical protein
MPTPSRRQQRAITIRSDHALARRALLTRDGRSQVKVIEEALDRLQAVNHCNDCVGCLVLRHVPVVPYLKAGRSAEHF